MLSTGTEWPHDDNNNNQRTTETDETSISSVPVDVQKFGKRLPTEWMELGRSSYAGPV